MKNYKQTASDVLRLVGGEKNVVQVEHCSTRLRFTLADTSKADAAALKKTAGVMGVISSGPQCQVVIGNDVIEVYDELLKLGTFNAGQAAAPAAPKGKKEIGGIILDYMVGIFQPLVPAIAGAGVLKALMVLLSTLPIRCLSAWQMQLCTTCPSWSPSPLQPSSTATSWCRWLWLLP